MPTAYIEEVTYKSACGPTFPRATDRCPVNRFFNPTPRFAEPLSIGSRMWYHDTTEAARRSLKFMPKRGSDADSRIFFDELLSVGVSRLKASGAIRLEDRQVLIPFGDRTNSSASLIRSFGTVDRGPIFAARSAGRSKKLWLVDDAPRCRLCLEKLGVRYRASYGFGRTERLRERDRRVDRLQAMLEGGPMRFKPVPPNWGNRRLDRRNRLTWALAASAYRHSPRPNSVPGAAKQRTR